MNFNAVDNVLPAVIQQYSAFRGENDLGKQNFLNAVKKNIGLSVGCIGTGLFLGHSISINAWSVGKKILHSTNFCFSKVFPDRTEEIFGKLADPLELIIKVIGYDHCSSSVVYSPIYEELTIRVLLQEVLLKRVPEKILEKVSPQHAHLTNHFIAKITRVFLSSVCFALAHPEASCCACGDMYPYLIAGVALGTLQEVSGHPFYSITAHMLANLQILESNGYPGCLSRLLNL